MLQLGLRRNDTQNEKTFFSSSTCLNSVWLELEPEWHFFFNYFIFFWNFFGNVPARVKQKWYHEWNFFLSFSAYPDSVWLEMKSEWSFFNCSNLFTIFLGMLQPESGRNGTKNNFFFSFSACPSPVWLKKNCLNFFTICFEFFLECSNLGWALIFFFFSFLACLDLVWQEMKPKWHFWIFFT